MSMYKRTKNGPWCALRLIKFMNKTKPQWDIYVVLRQREANSFSYSSCNLWPCLYSN